MFFQLNVEIDEAVNTEKALKMLKQGNYDLIISDIARGNDKTAGLDFLKQLRNNKNTTPVIFYIGEINPKFGVPAQAFGITNRPDELLHLALDALERKKY